MNPTYAFLIALVAMLPGVLDELLKQKMTGKALAAATAGIGIAGGLLGALLTQLAAGSTFTDALLTALAGLGGGLAAGIGNLKPSASSGSSSGGTGSPPAAPTLHMANVRAAFDRMWRPVAAACAACAILVFAGCAWFTPTHMQDVATVGECVLTNEGLCSGGVTLACAEKIAQVCAVEDAQQVIDLLAAHKAAEKREAEAAAKKLHDADSNLYRGADGGATD